MKQLILSLTLLLSCAFVAVSQGTQLPKDQINNEVIVYDFAEVMPEYPGGAAALRKEVGLNYQIPENYSGTGGTIVLRFIVDEMGNVIEPKILKGIQDCDECSLNAIKVIKKLSQKFTPAMQAGEKVRVNFTLPIVVKMKGKKKKKRRRKRRA